MKVTEYIEQLKNRFGFELLENYLKGVLDKTRAEATKFVEEWMKGHPKSNMSKLHEDFTATGQSILSQYGEKGEYNGSEAIRALRDDKLDDLMKNLKSEIVEAMTSDKTPSSAMSERTTRYLIKKYEFDDVQMVSSVIREYSKDTPERIKGFVSELGTINPAKADLYNQICEDIILARDNHTDFIRKMQKEQNNDATSNSGSDKQPD